jgi:hypothetical protein
VRSVADRKQRQEMEPAPFTETDVAEDGLSVRVNSQREKSGPAVRGAVEFTGASISCTISFKSHGYGIGLLLFADIQTGFHVSQ